MCWCRRRRINPLHDANITLLSERRGTQRTGRAVRWINRGFGAEIALLLYVNIPALPKMQSGYGCRESIISHNNLICKTMKKLTVLFACLFSLQAAIASADRPIQLTELPQTAQQFISANFPGQKVAIVTEDTDLLDKSYEVTFATADKVEFDREGRWTEIRCKNTAVPSAVVPAEIMQYVASNYPDAKIITIERDRHRYEVDLSNGWELKFDSNFNLIDIDD